MSRASVTLDYSRAKVAHLQVDAPRSVSVHLAERSRDRGVVELLTQSLAQLSHLVDVKLSAAILIHFVEEIPNWIQPIRPV